MKKLELKINGKKVTLGGPGEKAAKIIAFLKILKDGEYFDAVGIAERVQASRETISKLIAAFPVEVEGHWVKFRDGESTRVIFGSKRSINELKKQLEIA